MEWSKFEDKFHPSWHKKMKPFIESPECDKIYAHLKERSKRGHVIAPSSSNTFRCFLETPWDEMKVVLMGMAPYHTQMKTLNGNVIIADGLLMGCSNTGILQPSLKNFYDAIEREVYSGFAVDKIFNPDVSYLAKQGVLMFNASLTTEINKAGSHLELWEPFTRYVMEEVVAPSGVPIVFLGKDAAAFERYVAPFQWSFTVTHPAAAAYKGTIWDSERVFHRVNTILKDVNNFSIEWLDEKYKE